MNRTAWVILAGGVAAAAALTGSAPLAVLVLGPLLLGVPHVLGDVRFLVSRPLWPVDLGRLAWAGVPLAGLVATRVATLAGLGAFPGLEVALGVTAAALAAGAAPGAGRWLGLAIVAVAAAPALAWPQGAALWLGHLHNGLAIAVWAIYAMSRRQVALAVGGVACATIGALVVLTAPIPAATAAFGGLAWGKMLDTLAPGVLDPWASRLVLLYAYLQFLHYGVWTLALPMTARPGAGAAGWWRDLGPTLAIGGLVGALVLPLAGSFAPATVRGAYLSLVLFHGWLEVAIFAYWASCAAGQATERSWSRFVGIQRANV